MIIGAFAFFAWHLKNTITNYLSYRVTESTTYSTRDTEFPYVTLCASEAISSYNFDDLNKEIKSSVEAKGVSFTNSANEVIFYHLGMKNAS